jgi:hypothetical protein
LDFNDFYSHNKIQEHFITPRKICNGMMSRTGEEDEVSPKFDEEGNPVNVDESSMSGASNASTL